MKCIGPRAKDANLWILIWEESHRVHQEGILLEVEHLKVHRSKKEKQQMSLRTINSSLKAMERQASQQKRERC